MSNDTDHRRTRSSGGLLSRVQQAWGPGPLHAAKLKGPAPDRLYLQPTYPRTPDHAHGLAILRGRMNYGDASLEFGPNSAMLWQSLPADTKFQQYAHGFSWLNDVAAAIENHSQADDEPNQGNPHYALHRLVSAWLDHHEKWSPDVWQPRLTAVRLMHLCCHGRLILDTGDMMWRSRVLTAMARQARHLAQTAHKADAGMDVLLSAMGLTLAGLCIPACDVALERGQELLKRELRLQFRSDGGHISRNPSTQLELVIRLQMIAKAYAARKLTMPGHIRLALDRAAAMVRFFRCGDGGLAIFNGGYEADHRAIIAASEALQDDTIPLGFARFTQYQRLSAARALIIADTGADTTSEKFREKAGKFDSAGSFHFSSGRARIIENCGNGDHLGEDWPKALRLAAAHSGFSLDLAHSVQQELFSGETIHQRAEEVSGILLELSRPFAQKYTAPPISEVLGETYLQPGFHRRLYLAAGGDDFRGEDSIIGLPVEFADYWAIRFHLHPTIKASLARDEQSVILALPNQEGWRFRTNFKGVKLENSIYCGAGAQPQASEQIIICPPPPHNGGLDRGDKCDIIIKWAFKRLDGV